MKIRLLEDELWSGEDISRSSSRADHVDTCTAPRGTFVLRKSYDDTSLANLIREVTGGVG